MWTVKYYTEGCCSWKWFFPEHYTVYPTELCEFLSAHMNEVKEITFEFGEPFKPFEQLVAVLPPESAACLPVGLQSLLTNPDSVIADFYPKEVSIDSEKGGPEWQDIPLLNFVDETRLLQVVRPLLGTQLTEAEKKRNTFGVDLVLVNREHKEITMASGGKFFSTQANTGGILKPLTQSDEVLTFEFSLPSVSPPYLSVLPGAQFPPPKVEFDEISFTVPVLRRQVIKQRRLQEREQRRRDGNSLDSQNNNQ